MPGWRMYVRFITNWATWLAVVGAWATALAALWQLRLQRIQLTAQNRILERAQADNGGVLVASSRAH